ncbi:MAG: hypothetical protein KBA31_11610 [Alphaproteobacteria bacterium]|nr:hypothetical protein [Alphaproteobacteria bacterium]
MDRLDDLTGVQTKESQSRLGFWAASFFAVDVAAIASTLNSASAKSCGPQLTHDSEDFR